jgi:hypothetical protein
MVLPCLFQAAFRSKAVMWLELGREVTREKSVTVRGGRTSAVDFSK